MNVHTASRLAMAVFCAGAMSASLLPWSAAQAEQPDSTLAQFIARRDQCDHFRGEEAYDSARRRFLVEQVRRYCTGTDRQLAELRRRYAHDQHVICRLARFEENVE